MYTVYKVKIDGYLTGKQHLNNALEVDQWMHDSYQKGIATVRLVKDQTGQSITYTDDGLEYVKC